jgi:hypothetical protein
MKTKINTFISENFVLDKATSLLLAVVFFSLAGSLPAAKPKGKEAPTAGTGSTVFISGKVTYCVDSNPVPGVSLNVTGSIVTSGLTDGAGNYSVPVPGGGNYLFTPAHAPRPVTSAGIDTVDAVAAQFHYLNIAPLTGCAFTAADVNENGAITTVDVLAIQRFFIGRTFGIGNAGQYRFTPANKSYPNPNSDQVNQDYTAIILGDVVSPFIHRADGPSTDAATQDASVIGTPGAVQAVSLPNIGVDSSRHDLTLPVTTTAINKADRLVGFQGDFTFDERMIIFQSEPVQNAGLTDGNWTVSGNVLPGRGPMRTLRVSALSNDLSPLAGTGVLFELRVTEMNGSTQLIWAEGPHQFTFIDSDLKVRAPGYSASGRVNVVH